jgi:motility quorum-sensing regulator / GCU-specific mRNA interferase toxin
VEKRKPTYDLAAFKVVFSTPAGVHATAEAFKGARSAGLGVGDMIAVIQSMSRAQFYKSMTSYADSAIWQDVYHVPAASSFST